MDYKERISKLRERQQTARDFKAVVLAVRDTELLYYLKNKEPETWQRFKEWVHERSEGQ